MSLRGLRGPKPGAAQGKEATSTSNPVYQTSVAPPQAPPTTFTAAV